jgi:predicted GTPase
MTATRTRVIIMGAGGRDFHVFNCRYRSDDSAEVVAFTANQIPNIDTRSYPSILAGPLYPDGIPIRPEAELEQLIKDQKVDEVVFAYSDVPYDYLDEVSQRIEAAGASFRPFEPEDSLLKSSHPCIAVCAVRTGCGKSPLSRYIAAELRKLGARPGVLRHPMPYGNLRHQISQRFETVEDLKRHDCTIEEMEEYEPHIDAGSVVFAGTDYQEILTAAEAESDVILWDGGNNDVPFIRPDLLITVLDPLRAGDELSYFPGRWNFEHADVLVIAKIDEASADQLATLKKNIATHNSDATVVEAGLKIDLDNVDEVQGKRVLVVEDGPTITHGGMAYGAGYLAAQRAGAAEIVDPRTCAVGDIAAAYDRYPHIGPVLPALGYGDSQLADLQATIERADCDSVIVATPIDLARIIELTGPTVRVTYEFEDRSGGKLKELLAKLVLQET